jgi:hypothetical protein
MSRRLTWLTLSIMAATGTALYHSRVVRATPANTGFVGKTAVVGRFAPFQVFNQVSRNSLPAGFGGDTWLSLQKTQGPSDVYVQTNTWAMITEDPNTHEDVIASTGWHSHPGHSLIIITSGAITEYEDDCKPRVYGPGQPLGNTLVDPGGTHVHLIRNESRTTPAAGYAVQLTPASASRRIDAPAPEACSSLKKRRCLESFSWTRRGRSMGGQAGKPA